MISLDRPASGLASRFINRELSWLAFNARVLAQAEDRSKPLLERLKFCAIHASNLDEFFQVRVAGLTEQVEAGVSKAPPDGLSPRDQLSAIRNEVLAQEGRVRSLAAELIPALAGQGVDVVTFEELSPAEASTATAEFGSRIFPVLTPLAVDSSHPFPYISNLSLNLAVLVDDPAVDTLLFARIKVPPTLPRFLPVAPHRYVPTEQVIAAHLDQLFPGLDVVGAWSFRVTRNADLSFDDSDADDLLEAIEDELKRRNRFGRAIRLELDRAMPASARDLIQRELELSDDEVYEVSGLLDLTGLWELANLDRPDLRDAMVPSVTPRSLREVRDSHDFFARIAQADIIVHHPYDSFGASTTEMIRQASLDPDVQAIKLTLYRTSGDSPIIGSLIRAAEQGKQVAALIELKARFDEEANITWARRLEQAGVHVVYGLAGLKIHTKTALVVRNEPNGVRRYCHVGTGNYNPKTARIYEDFGILTADPEIGRELSQLFNYLTGYGREVSYDRLLVAPHSLRQDLADLIDGEIAAARAATADRAMVVADVAPRSSGLGPSGDTVVAPTDPAGGGDPTASPVEESMVGGEPRPAGGPGGRIILKMNSLVDADIIDRLYAASQEGVEIDLIVRGICCLRAGVPGLSDRIRVRSIVGRYLEHSRVLYFANGGGRGVEQFYIGSADLMPRNLDRRVEVMVRVDDHRSRERLREALAVNLSDTALAWELQPDGSYRRLEGGVDSHRRFEELATGRAAAAHHDGDVAEHTVRAAGCLVYRTSPAGPEVLLVHRPRYGDWSFPKGKREPGESDLACALREVEEETGFRGEVGRELPASTYEVGGRPKIVRYWLLRQTDGAFVANEEVDRIQWATPAEAADLVAYDHDRRLLREVPDGD